MLTHDDFIGKQIALLGYYEKVMLNYIKNLNIKGSYIDVGANIGNHSLYFAKECGNKIFAFEPDIENYRLLEENTKKYNVTSFNIGIGSCKSMMGIERYRENMGMNRLIEGNDVEVSTIDIFEFEEIGLIKIDVEGMEIDVLKGAKKTIEKYKPSLFIENSEPNKLLKFLPEGYKVIQRFNSTPTYYFRYENNC